MEQTLARSMARIVFAAATAATAAGITACGDGGSSPAPAPAPAPPSAGPTADEAARFLTQATFGPTDPISRHVQVDRLFGMDRRAVRVSADAALAVRAGQLSSPARMLRNFNFMQDSFWQQAIPAPDQLRQRVKFALSQTCRRLRCRQHDRRLLRRLGQLRRSARAACIRQLSGSDAGSMRPIR